MSNSEARLAALEAEIRRLKAKEQKPPKSNEDYISDLQRELDQGPGRVRNSLDSELAKGDRAREIAKEQKAVEAIIRAGGKPGQYDIDDLHRACQYTGWNSNYFEGVINNHLMRQASEGKTAKTGEGPEEPTE